ncbi:MAG: DUF3990 domain-containing protein [Planctomycetes bacterium]|nr:DUF3990 domain-containing protein [Planctomycetota bacterium]
MLLGQLQLVLVVVATVSAPVTVADPNEPRERFGSTGQGRSSQVARKGALEAGRAGASVGEVRFTYNQAGQPVSVTTFDRSPLGLEQTFTSTAAYDALGRLFQATDPAGHTGRLLYDSRGNVIAASDAHSQVTVPNLPGLWPPTVNGHGNVARTFYDGLSRPVVSEVLLKKGGVGDGSLEDTNLDTTNASNPDGKITITQRWDRNSRLVSRSDDNGNTTGWAYDARDRVVYTLGADLSVQRTLYDPDSLVRQTIDRNGTVIDRSYDAAGRLLKVEATRRATNLEGTGQAVEGTAVQAFEYDGLHRVRLAVDQNDPLDPTDDVATSFTYDSLGRQLTERHRFRAQTSLVSTFATQGRIAVGAAGIDRTITRTFDLDSNRTSTTYSSGRTLTYQLDGLDRLQAIRDSVGTITAMEFVGGRPLASTTGRGTVSTSYSYDAKRRLTGLDHVGPAGRVAGFAYAWDRADRRSSETHLPALGVQARTETYTYDSASRITRVAFGDARPDTSWVIDGVGNWVSRTEGGQTQTTNQRQNGKYAPDLMNEVQRLATFNALGSLVKDEQHTQDPNGNRIKSGEWRLSFDVFDRLVRVERTSDGATVGRYRYDALGRRVDRWFVARGEAVGQQAFHVNDGAQEVEEVDAAGNVVADYVWGGLYLDQVVQVRRGGHEYHLHANSIWSVVAATDASGAVVERYSYASIYGVASVRDGTGAPRPASEEIGNPWRFQGRRLDPETGFYYFRLRYLDPEGGRFVSRDPLGIWGDAGNLGNGYAFAGNDPVNRVDPWGLFFFSPVEFYDRLNKARQDYSTATDGVEKATAVLNGMRTLVEAPMQWLTHSWMTENLLQRQAQAVGDVASGQATVGGAVASYAVDIASGFVPFARSIENLDRAMQSGDGFLIAAALHELGTEAVLLGMAGASVSRGATVGTLRPRPSVPSTPAPAAPEAAPSGASGSQQPATPTFYRRYYHATPTAADAANIQTAGIDLSRGRATLDFGRGFYTTTDLAQAARWGRYVLEFKVSLKDLGNLRVMRLEAGPEFVSIVRQGRAGTLQHAFDIIEGPMLLNPRQFVRGAQPAIGGQQTCFTTVEATRVLQLSTTHKF